ncbi:hypothetical protein BTH42_15505 [Burkholderia sp. SRS-W-2-2016]|uniref:aKG-HExxH-type peptide beta-hydroxylase n=1 Tax=Burkholderia sp. SRS-W-2-2016 TaxID=1926878 RepID=UPI00094B4C4D|nr:HEXXH motif-containing putative peptide modification protein [Burkholderia sp. SRS-W-2-2016]OLL30734.1 hypothetical protein BTH42_15505 [Burkholderia sp. SRS-W-2-2016]
MILQLGMTQQIETLVTLTGTIQFASSKKYQSLEHLRKGYRGFLAKLDQRPVNVDSTEIMWITDGEALDKLRTLFSNDSLLDDKKQAIVINDKRDDNCASKEARLAIALNELSLCSHEYGEIVRTVITDIFVLPSDVAKGGSTSQAIGVIWANPKLTYTVADIIEILVHEFTHHSMFLDELRYGHYSYAAVLDQKTWAHSAILNVQRPLDKVLHSIIVATEVLLFRSEYLGHPVKPRVHPPTEILLTQLQDSISSAEEIASLHKGILQQRALELLENVKISLRKVVSRQTHHSDFSSRPINVPLQ